MDNVSGGMPGEEALRSAGIEHLSSTIQIGPQAYPLRMVPSAVHSRYYQAAAVSEYDFAPPEYEARLAEPVPVDFVDEVVEIDEGINWRKNWFYEKGGQVFFHPRRCPEDAPEHILAHRQITAVTGVPDNDPMALTRQETYDANAQAPAGVTLTFSVPNIATTDFNVAPRTHWSNDWFHRLDGDVFLRPHVINLFPGLDAAVPHAAYCPIVSFFSDVHGTHDALDWFDEQFFQENPVPPLNTVFTFQEPRLVEVDYLVPMSRKRELAANGDYAGGNTKSHKIYHDMDHLLINEADRKRILRASRDLGADVGKLVTTLDENNEPETYYVVRKAEPLLYFDVVAARADQAKALYEQRTGELQVAEAGVDDVATQAALEARDAARVAEQIERGFCPRAISTSQSGFVHYPDVFTVNLQRKDKYGGVSLDKVKPEERIELTAFDGSTITYELQSTVVHSGGGAGGHYTSNVFTEKGWLYTDDAQDFRPDFKKTYSDLTKSRSWKPEGHVSHSKKTDHAMYSGLVLTIYARVYDAAPAPGAAQAALAAALANVSETQEFKQRRDVRHAFLPPHGFFLAATPDLLAPMPQGKHAAGIRPFYFGSVVCDDDIIERIYETSKPDKDHTDADALPWGITRNDIHLSMIQTSFLGGDKLMSTSDLMTQTITCKLFAPEVDRVAVVWVFDGGLDAVADAAVAVDAAAVVPVGHDPVAAAAARAAAAAVFAGQDAVAASAARAGDLMIINKDDHQYRDHVVQKVRNLQGVRGIEVTLAPAKKIFTLRSVENVNHATADIMGRPLESADIPENAQDCILHLAATDLVVVRVVDGKPSLDQNVDFLDEINQQSFIAWIAESNLEDAVMFDADVMDTLFNEALPLFSFLEAADGSAVSVSQYDAIQRYVRNDVVRDIVRRLRTCSEHIGCSRKKLKNIKEHFRALSDAIVVKFFVFMFFKISILLINIIIYIYFGKF